MVTRDERGPQQQPTGRVKAARSHSSLTAASEEAAPRSAGRRAEELPTARALFQSAGRFIILSSAASRGSPRRLRKRGSPSRYMSPESFTSKVRPSQKKSAPTIRATRSCSRAGPTQIVRYCRNICRSARSASTASKDSSRREASAGPRGRCSRCFRTRATSASGCCSSTPSRSPIWKQPTVRLCRSLGYVGVFQCEFIEHEGEHLLIDFNPRFYNYMAFDHARGLPQAYLAYLHALGANEELNAEIDRARQVPPHLENLVYCYHLGTWTQLLIERLFRRISADESKRWRGWHRAATGLVDLARPTSCPKSGARSGTCAASFGTIHDGRFESSLRRGNGALGPEGGHCKKSYLNANSATGTGDRRGRAPALRTTGSS